MENMEKGCLAMAELLSALQNKSLVRIHDPRSAALIFESTSYYLILDWLNSDQEDALTAYAYPLCLYNLQAMGIEHKEKEIQGCIDQVIGELSKRRRASEMDNEFGYSRRGAGARSFAGNLRGSL